MSRATATVHAFGRQAPTAWSIPPAGWKQIFARTWSEAGTDNLGLIAAGVAFYGFLAIVPILGSIVISYGLVASPETVMKTVIALTKVMPTEAAELVGKELTTIVSASGSKKGLGLALAILVSLYGAMNAAGAIVTALNIAYEEKEKRGFMALLLLSLLITLAGLLLIVVSVVTIAVTGYLGPLLPTLPGFALILGRLLTYVVMTCAGAAAAASLYRFGPSRRHAKWTWLSPGSLLTAALWLTVSAGFGLYVANFGNYDATYGSLGAVVVLLTWLYLSAYVLLIGAELNAEVERQTACDSTRGAARPLGQRGAIMADTVAMHGAEIEDPAPLPAGSPAAVAKADASRARPRPIGELLASRATARLLHAGLRDPTRKLPLLPSILTTAGLMMLRRKQGEPLGVALLLSGGSLAWLGRERPLAAMAPALVDGEHEPLASAA